MRLIKSYASDFINGVSDGQVLTLKHFLLGLALYSITVLSFGTQYDL